MPNWSLKAEYLFYNLGTAYATGANALRNNYNTTNASWSNLGTLSTGATRPAGAGAYDYGVATHTKFSGNLVQAGVNRHFDLFSE